MSENIKALRITVLGPAASGKTCLINAYVNNTCPNVYTPTDDPMLYYRTLRAERNDKLITVMLELEDTYCSTRTDGKDRFSKNRNIQNFIALKNPNEAPVSKEGPWAGCPPPTENAYEPLSLGRMAFLILFDINDEKSYAHAVDVYNVLNERHKPKVDKDNEPLIYLVANKIDEDPYGASDHSTAQSKSREKISAWLKEIKSQHSDESALEGSKPCKFTFIEVSALEFTRVRRLFRAIVDDLLENRRALWGTAADDNDGKEVAATATFMGGLGSMGGLFGGGGGTGGGLFGSLWG